MRDVEGEGNERMRDRWYHFPPQRYQENILVACDIKFVDGTHKTTG
jgi:hypothetical protein